MGIKADPATIVNRDEVDRLRKRFMKLDKVGQSSFTTTWTLCSTNNLQDASGTIDRDEFLSLPQVSSNPLATRSVAPPIPTLCAHPRSYTQHQKLLDRL